MQASIAFTMIMAIMFVSDLVSKVTKGRISIMLASNVIFLVVFLGDFSWAPGTVGVDSGLATMGVALLPFTLVNVGSTISLQDFKKQWKTFAIGSFAVAGIGLFVFGIGSQIVHVNYAIGAAGTIAGGGVAMIMTNEVMTNFYHTYGNPHLLLVAGFPWIVSTFQMYIGIPIASAILRKEAVRVKKAYHAGEIKIEEEPEGKQIKEDGNMPSVFRSPAGSLFLAGACVVMSIGIEWVGANILGTSMLNRNIMSLFFGIGLGAINFVPKGFLFKIDSYALINLSLFAVGIGAISALNFNDFVNYLPMVGLFFALGVAAILIFSIIMAKLLKVSTSMGIAIGMSSLFGFPSTMIISKEIAETNSDTPEEEAILLQEIQPKMIIAGFSTVTISSVILITFLLNFATPIM
jgi:hypothetical protein